MDKKDIATITIFNHRIKFWLVIEMVLVLVMVIQILGMIYFFDLFEDIQEAERIMEIRNQEFHGFSRESMSISLER